MAAHMGELPAQIVMVLTGVFLLVSLAGVEVNVENIALSDYHSSS